MQMAATTEGGKERGGFRVSPLAKTSFFLNEFNFSICINRRYNGQAAEAEVKRESFFCDPIKIFSKRRRKISSL
jgi:hypothetical protein